VMEIDNANIDCNQEDEYVLLDLDAVCGQVDIPPNEPYILSGLDTQNPVLAIGNDLKLVSSHGPYVFLLMLKIGEYEETIGTCLIFSENEKTSLLHEEIGPSEANRFKNDRTVDPNLGSSKHIKPVTSLHKILKFRVLTEVDGKDMMEKPPDPPAQENDPTKKN
uniref:Transcription factor TFIIIC triple barrel domain-containing protein n=1 Tax=Chenopodium quinoa TaxID=63459 RepID=A0A803NAB1_CHEQI